MRSTLPLVCLLLAFFAPMPAENDSNAWIFFDSREAESGGPRLALQLESGETKVLRPSADTTLISYLSKGVFGRQPDLSISVGDTNRALLQFDLAGVDRVRTAELVLHAKMSPLRPREPFEIALHRVTAAWRESDTSWDSQPAIADAAPVTATVEARDAEMRVVVTDVVNEWANGRSPNHGWLIKVTHPVAQSVAASGVSRALEKKLLASIPWEATVEAARERARREGKRVLALVRGAWKTEDPCLLEQVLLATEFADPDVRALVLARFVPVRVAYSPMAHTCAHEVAGDPLHLLGAAVRDVKAPALLVADGGGKRIASLESIGTFDRDLALDFLRRAAGSAAAESDPWKLLAAGRLNEAARAFASRRSPEKEWGLCRVAALGSDHETALKLAHALAREAHDYSKVAAVQEGFSLLRLGRFDEAETVLRREAERSPEAAYWLGCLLDRGGRSDEAKQRWQAIVRGDATSPWALKAEARLAWPERLAMYESLTSVKLGADARTTEMTANRAEESAVVNRAIDYLLSHQRGEGKWCTAESPEHDAAITALAARALLVWSDALDGDRKRRALAALAKARAWMSEDLRREDPQAANSWGAAYLLDFFVDLARTDASARPDVTKAIAFLVEGQCPNGAWSYSRQFGTGWKGGFGGWPVTEKGRTHSMNTGPALGALVRASKAGFTVDAEALSRGKKALLAMRKAPGVYTYTWPEPISFDEPDQSIGRASSCEGALFLAGATPAAELRKTLDLFLEFRKDLRLPAKLNASWSNPHAFSSYFCFFAYYHAARAMSDLGGAATKTMLATLRDDLLGMVEADGTWLDFEDVGKPYGTATALIVLRLAR